MGWWSWHSCSLNGQFDRSDFHTNQTRSAQQLQLSFATDPTGVEQALQTVDSVDWRTVEGNHAVSVYAKGTEELPLQRAKLEVDYEHHGKGYVFGAFRPATGEVITRCYTRRTLVNWIAFLTEVDKWVDPDVERIYVIMDNLMMHKGTATLLFALAHPRWEFVYQPKRAAYLNLIEPWWKNLRSLAFAGQSFESWEEVCEAVKKATSYWNAHRHPFVWGRRRRHQPRRTAGIALIAAHP